MTIINDEKLLKMFNEGISQKDIAVALGVSPAAVCKRLPKAKSQAQYMAVLDNLTVKEQKFVAEICSGVSQTQAAITAFDVGSYDSGKAIGHKLSKDENIQLAIMTIMEAQGLTRMHLVGRLRHHIDGSDANISLRATVEGLKLADAYPVSKSISLNVNLDHPVDFSRYL